MRLKRRAGSPFPKTIHQPTVMKADIHPVYNETTVTCACGAVYHTRSTVKDLKIGICAACHPHFTGEQRFVDTAGRVDKFAKRFGSTVRRAAKPKLTTAA
jgi:large subunit ribosomal protein L31